MIFQHEQIFSIYAQNYIFNQLKRKGPIEMGGLFWGSKNLGLGPDEYGLIVNKGKKKIVFTFPRAELIERYGSSEWKAWLLDKIEKILKTMET